MAQKKPAQKGRVAAVGNTPEDARFLADYDPNEFERPSLTVDVVLLTVRDAALEVALLQRSTPPDKGRHALPGTFVAIAESLEAAAQRVVQEKIGLGDVFLEQLYTFGDPKRDPRTRIITVAYYALVDAGRIEVLDNAALCIARLEVLWAGETGGRVDAVGNDEKALALAFDHDEVIGMAVRRLRGKLNYTPIGYQLLPQQFTLRQLQTVHETILGHGLNKDSFRRRMLATGELEATGTLEDEVGHRPAELYRFTRRSAV